MSSLLKLYKASTRKLDPYYAFIFIYIRVQTVFEPLEKKGAIYSAHKALAKSEMKLRVFSAEEDLPKWRYYPSMDKASKQNQMQSPSQI